MAQGQFTSEALITLDALKIKVDILGSSYNNLAVDITKRFNQELQEVQKCVKEMSIKLNEILRAGKLSH